MSRQETPRVKGDAVSKETSTHTPPPPFAPGTAQVLVVSGPTEVEVLVVVVADADMVCDVDPTKRV